MIALLTATNALGMEYGKIIQNSFTVAKFGALAALIVLGLSVGWHASSVHANLAASGSDHLPLLRKAVSRLSWAW